MAQLLEVLIADRGSSACDLVGKMNYGLVFFVEEFAAVIKSKRVDLFIGDSNPLRRSGVSLGSIFAAIQDRGFKIGEFFIAVVQCSGAGGCGIKGKKVL